MPKKSPKAKSKTFSRLMRIGHTNLAILAAFMLVFVGLGAWFVNHSEAAGPPCVSRVFYYYEPGTIGSQCVKDLQQMLHNIGDYYYTYNGFSNSGIYPPDGVYGSATRTQVVDFQKFSKFPKSGQDGEVGPYTWSYLCTDDSQTGGTSVYKNAGC